MIFVLFARFRLGFECILEITAFGVSDLEGGFAGLLAFRASSSGLVRSRVRDLEALVFGFGASAVSFGTRVACRLACHFMQGSKWFQPIASERISL